MASNVDYAKALVEKEGYEKPIVAFRLTDDEPKEMESYGTGVSFLCAMVAEAWAREEPF